MWVQVWVWGQVWVTTESDGEGQSIGKLIGSSLSLIESLSLLLLSLSLAPRQLTLPQPPDTKVKGHL